MFCYENIFRGVFLARPNRFLAHVEINGREVLCHVKNTGRCRELLIPGTPVWCSHHSHAGRKTAWSLIAVEKQDRLINIDSQVPNKLAAAYVAGGGLGFLPTYCRQEQKFGQSRFDLYYESGHRKGFVEVKGVTLENHAVARFPDAPTERGRKHLLQLQEAVSCGYEAWVLFVIQMGNMVEFRPNWPQDPGFAQALCQAACCGVQIRAVGCTVYPQCLEISYDVPVVLTPEDGVT